MKYAPKGVASLLEESTILSSNLLVKISKEWDLYATEATLLEWGLVL